jgi:hypothetical protein
MQSKEFSEEYYKMKYFKYKAKYEQIKEIAQARKQQQDGGSIGSYFGFGSKQPVQQQAQDKNVIPPRDANNDQQQQQPSSRFQSAKQLYTNYSAEKQQKKETKQADVQQLMSDIHVFIKQYIKPKNERKYYKLVGKIEDPVSANQIVQIIENIKTDLETKSLTEFKTVAEVLAHADIENKKHLDEKKDLIKRIKSVCSTVTGGINTSCKFIDLEDRDLVLPQTEQQRAGYINSPNSLDDMSDF